MSSSGSGFGVDFRTVLSASDTTAPYHSERSAAMHRSAQVNWPMSSGAARRRQIVSDSAVSVHRARRATVPGLADASPTDRPPADGRTDGHPDPWPDICLPRTFATSPRTTVPRNHYFIYYEIRTTRYTNKNTM